VSPATRSKSDRSDFATVAEQTLRTLRRATAAVLAACGGLERAVDVATRFGLDRSLAWKVWHIGYGTGATPSPAHIPGRLGYARFLDAAGVAGVGAEVIAEARASFAAFQQLLAHHAGDRATADSMLGVLTEEGRTRRETALRREACRANAYFLGVQASSLYQLDVLLAPEPGFMPDLVRIRGHFGLLRMRAGVTWRLARTTLMRADGPSGELHREPLLGGDASEGGLMPEFCSRPLPLVTRRVVDGVTVEDELAPGEVGQGGAVDVVTGEWISRMPRSKAVRDAVTMRVTTPAERLCYEVVAPPEVVERLTLRVHSTVQTEHPYMRAEDYDQIPVLESFEDLGPVADAPAAPEIPRQGAIMRWVLGAMWDRVRGSRVWRVRMRYPIVPSCLAAVYVLRV
jgi:hypothetical protein